MKRTIILIVSFLFISCYTLAESFTFKTIQKLTENLIIVEILNFENDVVTVTQSARNLEGKIIKEFVMVNEKVSDVFLNVEDNIVFLDESGRVVGAVFSTEGGIETSITFLSRGKLVRYLGKTVNPEFADTFKRLYQYICKKYPKAVYEEDFYTENPSETSSPDDISLELFIQQPFYFVPSHIRTMGQMVTALRNQGWPAEPYDNSFISVVSTSKFEIPYKLFGLPITDMSAYFHNGGELTRHSLKISRLKTEWNEQQCIEYAKKAIRLLQNAGYTITEGPEDRNWAVYYTRMKNGNRSVTVDVNKASLYSTLDAYALNISSDS